MKCEFKVRIYPVQETASTAATMKPWVAVVNANTAQRTPRLGHSLHLFKKWFGANKPELFSANAAVAIKKPAQHMPYKARFNRWKNGMGSLVRNKPVSHHIGTKFFAANIEEYKGAAVVVTTASRFYVEWSIRGARFFDVVENWLVGVLDSHAKSSFSSLYPSIRKQETEAICFRFSINGAKC